MTDQRLIKALRWCGSRIENCDGCFLYENCRRTNCIVPAIPAADRLEALLAENERLREVTKMMPKWHFSTERPTMEKIEDPEDEWWESDRAIVVTSKGVLTVATAWELNGEFGWTDEVDQTGVAVKMWMQLEPPCTEGVE